MRIFWPLSSVMTSDWLTTNLSSVDDLDGLDAVADVDLLDDAHAAGDAAERRVLAVQEVGRAQHDVDLAAGRVRIVGSRHAEHAAIERPLVELGLDRVARPTAAHLGIVQRQGLGLRIPELNHEVRLHAVHALAIVELLARELHEVLDVSGSVLAPELQDDLAALLHRDDGGRRLAGRFLVGGRRGLVLRKRRPDDERERAEPHEKNSGHAEASGARRTVIIYITTWGPRHGPPNPRRSARPETAPKTARRRSVRAGSSLRAGSAEWRAADVTDEHEHHQDDDHADCRRQHDLGTREGGAAA